MDTKINPDLGDMLIKVSALHEDPDNARSHDEKNIEAIKASLSRFGQQKPIVISEIGKVIAGNGTLAAARLLGWGEIACVRFVDDESSQAAYAIADNKTAELASWDLPVLSETLINLGPEDLGATGFSEEEIKSLSAFSDRLFEDKEEEEPILDDDAEIDPSTVKVPERGSVHVIGRHTLHVGDCVEVLKSIEDNSLDSIVCDPPYGIGFMGKGWDCDVPGEAWASECLRVLKPGGHLIAFAACRTIHRLMSSVEDAGFEVRDMISWLQWQGFPKSLDVSKAIDEKHGATREVVSLHPAPASSIYSQGERHLLGNVPITAPATDEAKQWSGWGTALKPAQEPAVLARKPLDGTVAENVIKWGVGGLNIDGCRHPDGDPSWPGPSDSPSSIVKTGNGNPFDAVGPFESVTNDQGRWPANIYVCPKPSRGEREEGCDELSGKTGAEATARKENTDGLKSPRAGAGRTASTVKNYHPTVKPVGLMRWLVRLVTPRGGTVLDTFLGSGTTMIAAEREGVSCIGIEREPEYAGICIARAERAATDGET